MKKRQNLKSGVSPLIDISNNNILFSDLDKANTLNSYFIMEIYPNFII